MARPRRSAQPPVATVSVRVTGDVAARWRAEATAAGVCLGDWLRKRVDAGQADLTGLRTQQRRPKPLGHISGADPALLRHLVAIGGDMNQIARSLTSTAVAAKPIDAVRVLVVLDAIERELHTIAGARVPHHAYQSSQA